jgi:hypothetical protein
MDAWGDGVVGTKDEYRIMNKEHRISKEGVASRHILTIKGTAPSAHHPSTFDILSSSLPSTFLVRCSIFFFFLSFLLTKQPLKRN